MATRTIDDVLYDHTGTYTPTPTEARRAARKLAKQANTVGDAGNKNLLKEINQLERWADQQAGLDDVAKQVITKPATKAATPTPPAKTPATRKTATGSTKRRTAPARRARGKTQSKAADIITRPLEEAEAQTLGRIGFAENAWAFSGIVMGLVITYVVLTNPTQVGRLLRGVETAVVTLVRPWSRFPDAGAFRP